MMSSLAFGALLVTLNQAPVAPAPVSNEQELVAVARLTPSARGLLSVGGIVALAGTTTCVATAIFLGIRAANSDAQAGAFYAGANVPTAAQAPTVVFWQARAANAGNAAVPLVVAAIASSILGAALLLIDGQSALHVSAASLTSATQAGSTPNPSALVSF